MKEEHRNDQTNCWSSYRVSLVMLACAIFIWTGENGVTNDIGKGKFSPEDICIRGQVTTSLWRAQGKPAATSSANPVNDVSSKVYYYDAVLWAVENSVTNGTGKGKFSPDDSCTRGQIVTFLYRILN